MFLKRLAGKNRRILVGACLLTVAFYAWTWLPPPAAFLPDGEQAVITVLDRHGEVLRRVPPRGQPRLVPVTLKQVDEQFVHWLVQSEDHRFFHHHGVVLGAFVRALRANLRAGTVVEGASTLTMQVVRLSLPRSGNRYWQKWREVVWAWRLEHRLSKEALLTLYLNRLPFSHYTQGVEMACRTYFGHGAEVMSEAEASLLAAMVSAPGFDPLRFPKEAEGRRLVWVRRMAGLGRLGLDGKKTQRLLENPPPLNPTDPEDRAPMFVAEVLRRVPVGATAVETTLDARLQTLVAAQAATVVDGMEARKTSRAAVVVLRTRSAEVLAYVADAAHDGRRETHNLPAQRRQPGSALKPFTYALAFDNGFTPADLLADVPTAYALPVEAGGGRFEPRNYDGLYHGPVRLRVALASSLNVAAVDLAQRLGVAPLRGVYNRLGLGLSEPPSHYGLGITLGNAEVRLRDLTAAYATLGRLGEHKELRFVRRWKDARGRWHWVRPKGEPERLFSEQAAFLVSDILRDDLSREPSFGRRSVLTFPFPVAAKTGTSSDYRDNWAMGYTPAYTVGVWVGRVSGKSLGGVSGITGAGPLFQRVVRLVHGRQQAQWYDPPQGLVRRPVCSDNGLAPGPYCPGVTEEWLPEGQRLPPDDWHHPHPTQPGRVITRYPPPFTQWARGQGVVTVAVRGTQDVTGAPAGNRFAVVVPVAGNRVLLSPTIPRDLQVLTLEVTPGGGPPYVWRLDGRPLGRTDTPQMEWPLREGGHLLEVTDGDGVVAERRFVVERTVMED